MFLIPLLAASQEPQRGIQLSPDPQEAAYVDGGNYALIIGIESYVPPLKRLNTPLKDAKDVATVLRDQYGFTVQLLLDREATRNSILEALNKYRRSLQSNDNLLIYFAGHGYNDSEKDEAFWLPVDANSLDSPNAISADDITGAVRAIRSLHVLVVSDSCYAGDIANIRRNVEMDEDSKERQQFIRVRRTLRSRTLISSGGDEPVADGGPSGHSVFAFAFLRALNSEMDDEFTAEDMFHDFLEKRVAGQSPGYFMLLNADPGRGDFVFVRKSGTSPSPNAATISSSPSQTSAKPSATASAPETVTEPSVPDTYAPTAQISANPEQVSTGTPVTLTWTTTNAYDVSINGIGSVSSSGVKTVLPTESTDYRLIARGDGGTAEAAVRVAVVSEQPPQEGELEKFNQCIQDKVNLCMRSCFKFVQYERYKQSDWDCQNFACVYDDRHLQGLSRVEKQTYQPGMNYFQWTHECQEAEK